MTPKRIAPPQIVHKPAKETKSESIHAAKGYTNFPIAEDDDDLFDGIEHITLSPESKVSSPRKPISNAHKNTAAAEKMTEPNASKE